MKPLYMFSRALYYLYFLVLLLALLAGGRLWQITMSAWWTPVLPVVLVFGACMDRLYRKRYPDHKDPRWVQVSSLSIAAVYVVVFTVMAATDNLGNGLAALF